MDATSFLLHQEQTRITAAINSAKNLIQTSKSCRDAVRHLHIPIKSPFQSMRHVFGMHSFEVAAEGMVRAIIDRQIVEFSNAKPEDKLVLRGRLMDDWQSLRGNLPNLCHYSERKLALVLHADTQTPRRRPSI